MRRILGFVLAGLFGAGLLPGCGPSLSEEDLGTVVFEVPDVPGSEEPYKLRPATTLAPAPSEPASPAGESPSESP